MARPLASLPPNVEHRLAGWTRIQEGLLRQPERRSRPTITISRQFGCEGFPLAERLQALMEQATGESWAIWDKTLIEAVSREENISMRLLRDLGDASRGIEALGLMGRGHVTHDEAFDKVARHLIQIAGLGNAIVVGRGGAVLCRELRNGFHVRLVAGLEWRVASMMQRLEMSRAEAEAMVRANSDCRDRFISERLGVNVSDPAHYDIIFNNERHRVDAMAAAILAYLRSSWDDPKAFKA